MIGAQLSIQIMFWYHRSHGSGVFVCKTHNNFLIYAVKSCNLKVSNQQRSKWAELVNQLFDVSHVLKCGFRLSRRCLLVLGSNAYACRS